MSKKLIKLIKNSTLVLGGGLSASLAFSHCGVPNAGQITETDYAVLVPCAYSINNILGKLHINLDVSGDPRLITSKNQYACYAGGNPGVLLVDNDSNNKHSTTYTLSDNAQLMVCPQENSMWVISPIHKKTNDTKKGNGYKYYKYRCQQYDSGQKLLQAMTPFKAYH